MVVILTLHALAGAGQAADHAVLGAQVQVKDPSAGGDAAQRTIVMEGKERNSATALVGDPTTAGATLTLFLGAAQQTYDLPQGVDRYTGKPHWRGTGGRFTYRDAFGENGAVTT